MSSVRRGRRRLNMPTATRRGRRRRKKQKNKLVSHQSPIPDVYATVMKYFDVSTVTTGFTKLQQYRANSLYDPDLTGVGHQPMGYDQLKILYNRYRVDAVHYTITVSNRVSEQLIIGVLPTNGATPSTLGEALEQPRTKFMALAPNGSGDSTKTLSGWISLKDVAAASGSMYKNDDRYQSGVDANPAEAIELNIFSSTATGSSTLLYDISVMLTYKVSMFDRIMLTQS